MNTELFNIVFSYDGGSFSKNIKSVDDNTSKENIIEIDDGEVFSYNGKNYALFENGLSWEEAQNYCESIGGHLVTINDKEEQDFISDMLSTASKKYYWLGGTKDENGNWNWVTGEDFDYTNWEWSEPNNSGGNENAIHLYRSNKKWNDLISTGGSYGVNNFGYICEWENEEIQVVAGTPFDYALFTGNNNKDLSLYTNNTTINGNVHSNSGFYFQGNKLKIDGICETVNSINAFTSSGSTSKITYKQENISSIDMLDVTSKIKEKFFQISDDVIYYGQDKIEISEGIASNKSIFFNGTTFNGTGFIFAKENINYNVNSLNANTKGQIFLCAEEGNIDFHGSDIKINGIIYAPNGTVTVNANSFELNGRMICDSFVFNGTTLKINAQDNDLDFIRDIIQKEDIPPIAKFEIEDKEIIRDTKNNTTASVKITDKSYSPDGDAISSRHWVIYYDENNDGEFSEEEIVYDNDENLTEVEFLTQNIGRYHIDLEVTEDTEKALSANTSNKTLTGFEVKNIAPTAEINIQKAKNVDLVVGLGDDVDYDQAASYDEAILKMKDELAESGINLNYSSILSSITAQDSFAWEEYDHYNYDDAFVPDLDKHIVFDGNDIKMIGYGILAYKDFLYVADDNPSEKSFSFDLDRDDNNWHSIDGGGFLFNTKIETPDEVKNDDTLSITEKQNKSSITGYCLLFNEDSATVYYLNDLNVGKFRNNYYYLVKNLAEYVGGVSYKNTISHSIKITASPDSVSVWDNDKLIISNLMLQDTGSYGYGPIVSNKKHGCDQQSYFTFSNIKMNSVAGKSLKDAVAEMEPKQGSLRYVVEISNSKSSVAITSEAAELAEEILKKDAKFIGVGNNLENIYKDFISLGGLEGGYSENSDVNSAVNTLKNKIIFDELFENTSIDKYLAKGTEVDYSKCYSDFENDTIYEEEWQYAIDGNIQSFSEPVKVFENTGEYTVAARFRDNPIGNNDALDEYRLWSNYATSENVFTVHSKPVADFDVNLYTTNDGKCAVKLTDNSYDPDHKDSPNKGILSYDYKYKKLSDEGWTKEKIPSILETGEQYLVKIVVTDIEGEKSEPFVTLINAVGESEAEADIYPPVITLSSDKNNVYLNETYTIIASATDESEVARFYVYVNDKLISEDQGEINITAEQEGQNIITCVADDNFGNVAQESIVVNVKHKNTEDNDSYDDNKFYIRVNFSKSEYTSGESAGISLSSNKQQEVDTLEWYHNGEYIGSGLSATQNVKLVNGLNILKVVATTYSGEVAEDIATCTYTANEIILKPQPVITSPKQGDHIKDVVNISGNVTFMSDKESLAKYSLEYKPYPETTDTTELLKARDNDEGYIVIASGDTLKDNELNYNWDISVLERGAYFLRFAATDNYNVTNIHTISFYANKNENEATNPVVDQSSDEVETTLTVSQEEVNIGDTVRITYSANTSNVKSSKLYIDEKLLAEQFGYVDYTFGESGLYNLKYVVETNEGNILTKTAQILVKGANVVYENGVYIELSKAKLEVGEEAVLKVQKDDTVTNLKVNVNDEETELENDKLTITSSEPKHYTINVTYTKDGEEITKTLNCEFFNKDEIPYATAILNIEDCPAITAPTAITGTARDSVGISKYELFYKEKDSSDWTLFASGTENVDNAELGTFDPTLLENGVYDIKLEVTDANGNISSVTEPVIVEGNLKIGVFNIGFTDLVTNLGGINLTLSRNYSTSKSDKSGDFGYGWSLGLTGLKVYETNPIYEGYYNSLQGSQLSTTYYTTQTKKHYVVVNYGNGETDKFELNLSPNPRPFMTSKQVELTFNCVSNKTSKLEIVGDNKAYFNSETGEGILYEDGIDYYNIQKYKITRKDGTVIIYNKTTGVESITDKNGNTITVTENGFEGSNGEKILITKDFEGRITSITNKKGNVRTYVYNKNGDLSSSFDFLNNEVKYIYDSEHHLIEIVDPNGIAVEKNIYDEDGRLIAVIDALGNRTDCDYTFASSNNCQTVKDENGNTTFYYYDDKGNLLSKTDAEGNSTKYTYDENGNTTSFTDENNYTSYYKYDDYNNLISATNNLGYKMEYTYNKYGQITSEKDSTGSIKSRTYDEAGNLLSEKASDDSGLYYEYDTFGNCILEKNDSGIYYKKKYDTAGNLISVTDNTGNYTEYSYDDNGNLLSEIYKDFDGNILKKDNYLYDDCDRITSFTDITGNSYNCKYDKNGHKTEETDTFGNTVTYSYDEAGNMTQKLYSNGLSESFCYDSMGNKTKYTDIYGNNIEYYYNKIGKKIKVKYDNNTYEEYQYTPTGLISSFRSKTGAVTKYEYDAVGNNISVTDAYNGKKKYTYDSLNRKISETDELGNEIKYEHNVYGLISKVIYPDETFETYTYDNILNKTSETDRGGNTKYYTYDSFGNLTKVTDALGGEYQYTYDKNSNLISVIDANKNVTQYDYNNMERLLNISLPMGMSDNSNYNNNGLLSSYTDFNGNTLSYLYNGDGKIQSQNYNNNIINFNYDKYGNISKVSDKDNDYTYIYDENGLLDKCNFTSTDFVDYEYDAFGNISSISTPYSEIKYNYDILNRVDSVIDKEGNETQYSYDAAGNIVSKLLPNGTEVAYRYDNCNRITSESIYDRNNILVNEYSYSYTTSGNISQIKENSGKITKYTYDNLYRLIREETFQDDKTTDLKEYTYDNVGNRLSMNDNGKLITYTYDNNDRLIAEGENTYYYDNNGSLTKIITPNGSKEYSYNEQGQLEKVTDGENTTEYKYDYLGNRICSISNGEKTNYVWDNSLDNPELLYQVTGDEVITYTYADTLISQNDTGNTSYYISDAQRNVRYLMDKSGNVTDSYDYSAFGCLKEHTGDSENKMLFAEQQYDSNIELYYLRARYMNPQNGNFISRDSYFGNIEEPLSLNKYIYAQNNPVNYYDPSGMYIEELIKGRMAHVIIEFNYWTEHVADIPENYKHTYVNGVYNGILTRGFIDIYNAKTHEIYEIKPNSQASVNLGYTQLDIYKRLIDDEQAIYGNTWPMGEVSVQWPLGSGSVNYRLYDAGIIIYDLYDIDSDYTWANFAKINALYGVATVGGLALTATIMYKSIPSLVGFVNTLNNIENNYTAIPIFL